MIKLLKESSKEFETEQLRPDRACSFEEENFDEDEDMVLPDELPDIDDLDRQIVYYLAGFGTYLKKLHGLLCSNCQEIFFVSKLMREFCIPLDSQLTQSRDRSSLEYVGTAVHHFFCDLEKIVRHFFRTNKMPTWIHGPAGQLRSRFIEARVHDIFLENIFFHSEVKSCGCD